MSEAELIAAIRRQAGAAAGALALGIGDDCAIYRPRGARDELLFTTDLLIEDVHFRRADHPAAAVGHKALARGLSDIAAMGAQAQFCLLSLALPEWADARWQRGFWRGFFALARRAGVTLAGGDLARAEKLACDIVGCGRAPRGLALRRDGARPGEAIFVSGLLGGSALGLETGRGKAWRRHLKPEPRLALGRFVRQRLKATAAMDLSDGLSIDLRRLCLASGVAARLDRPLPAFPGATLDHVLHGGEDYELLFTLPARARPPAFHDGVALTRIGAIEKGPAGQVECFGRPLAALGWDHFRR
ncbi:MAG: thiamine-phosphate kinase [Acidobacteria bacterium]|nr:thiamine-phosphate kinase [Acidobacteriota bacterium]